MRPPQYGGINQDFAENEFERFRTGTTICSLYAAAAPPPAARRGNHRVAGDPFAAGRPRVGGSPGENLNRVDAREPKDPENLSYVGDF